MRLAELDLKSLPQTIADIPENDYYSLRNKFFSSSDLAQCIEPVFARSLGSDRFFSVMLSKKSGRSSIKVSAVDKDHQAFQLGNRFRQDVITPCKGRCQRHVIGHLLVGDLLGSQSADGLNYIRNVHGVREVPNRLSPLNSDRSIEKKLNVNFTKILSSPSIMFSPKREIPQGDSYSIKFSNVIEYSYVNDVSHGGYYYVSLNPLSLTSQLKNDLNRILKGHVGKSSPFYKKNTCAEQEGLIVQLGFSTRDAAYQLIKVLEEELTNQKFANTNTQIKF